VKGGKVLGGRIKNCRGGQYRFIYEGVESVNGLGPITRGGPEGGEGLH